MLLCKVYFRLEIEGATLGWHVFLEKFLEALKGTELAIGNAEVELLRYL